MSFSPPGPLGRRFGHLQLQPTVLQGLLAHEMSQVFVVFVAHVFQQIGVG
jgi:hypothetical protein